MGEIADMMLDGTMCECCGVWMDDILAGEEAPGFPRYCSRECAESRGQKWSEARKVRDLRDTPPCSTKVTCPHCGKRVKEIGLPQHLKVKHAAEME